MQLLALDNVLLASASFDIGAITIRILHITMAIAAAGGVFFQLIALHPALQPLDGAQRRAIRESIVSRWRIVVFSAIAILLVTGLVNFLMYKIPELRTHPMKGLYHGLFGLKFLLALLSFHGATVLVLPGAKGERYRDNAGFWLKYMSVLFVLIIVIAAVLRNFPSAT